MPMPTVSRLSGRSESSRAYLALWTRLMRIWRTLCLSAVTGGTSEYWRTTWTPWRAKPGRVDLQGVIHQVGDGDGLDDAGDAGVVLLHGDDFLDVLDVAGQLVLLFVATAYARPASWSASWMMKRGTSLPLGSAVRKPGRSASCCWRRPPSLTRLTTSEPRSFSRDEGGGDVDAVEDVADVVEDARGDLGHAGLARGIHQLPVELVQFRRRPASAAVMSWKMPRIATG